MKEMLGIVLLVVLGLGIIVGLVCLLYSGGTNLLQSILIVCGGFGFSLLLYGFVALIVHLLMD